MGRFFFFVSSYSHTANLDSGGVHFYSGFPSAVRAVTARCKLPGEEGTSRGLNSPAGPVVASAWSGLRDAVHASPRPAGSPAFLAPAWSGPGRPAGRENEGDFMIH